MVEPSHIHFSSLEQMVLSGASAKRLLMACALGGVVGLEREWRHKDSGLRTNMLICMGSALFTIMSVVLAGGRLAQQGSGRLEHRAGCRLPRRRLDPAHQEPCPRPHQRRNCLCRCSDRHDLRRRPFTWSP